MWDRLKEHILQCNPNAKNDLVYVCEYCRPLLNSNKLPHCCILNGLKTELYPQNSPT